MTSPFPGMNPYLEHPDRWSTVHILVSRADLRPLADLYPFNLADAIPCFPVPLQPGDEEPVVDLQLVLNGVYDRSGYDTFIDYQNDPPPPLTPEELFWVDTWLKSNAVR